MYTAGISLRGARIHATVARVIQHRAQFDLSSDEVAVLTAAHARVRQHGDDGEDDAGSDASEGMVAAVADGAGYTLTELRLVARAAKSARDGGGSLPWLHEALRGATATYHGNGDNDGDDGPS